MVDYVGAKDKRKLNLRQDTVDISNPEQVAHLLQRQKVRFLLCFFPYYLESNSPTPTTSPSTILGS